MLLFVSFVVFYFDLLCCVLFRPGFIFCVCFALFNLCLLAVFCFDSFCFRLCFALPCFTLWFFFCLFIFYCGVLPCFDLLDFVLSCFYAWFCVSLCIFFFFLGCFALIRFNFDSFWFFLFCFAMQHAFVCLVEFGFVLTCFVL